GRSRTPHVSPARRTRRARGACRTVSVEPSRRTNGEAVALDRAAWSDCGGRHPGRLGDADDLPKRGVQVASRAVADGCRAAPERACPRPAGVGIDCGRRSRRGDGPTEGGGARLSGGALCAGYGAFL